MDLQLKGRSAWITGGSKGIGRACGQILADEGCSSILLISRTKDDLEVAAENIRQKTDASVEIYPADLSDGEVVRELWASRPAPDILVNNAGAIPAGTLIDVDEDRWREAWDLKVFGYINMCREAFSRMTERGSGVIVNVIGAGGDKPTATYIAGGGGNAALMAITKALGATSTPKGVRVVGINPGLIWTERLETQMRRHATRRLGSPDRWQELLDPKNPPGKPEHIASMVAFLASDLSSNTTGVVFTIDGGSSAR